MTVSPQSSWLWTMDNPLLSGDLSNYESRDKGESPFWMISITNPRISPIVLGIYIYIGNSFFEIFTIIPSTLWDIYYIYIWFIFIFHIVFTNYNHRILYIYIPTIQFSLHEKTAMAPTSAPPRHPHRRRSPARHAGERRQRRQRHLGPGSMGRSHMFYNVNLD